MRWVFSAIVLLVVVATASMATAGDCCCGGEAGLYGGGMYGYGGGMYGDGLSALSARACAAPIYGWTGNFCPETPRCTGLWDNYCNEHGLCGGGGCGSRCGGCCSCRVRSCVTPCCSKGPDCGPTRAWSADGAPVGAAVAAPCCETAVAPRTHSPQRVEHWQVRRLPATEPSTEKKLPVRQISTDSS